MTIREFRVEPHPTTRPMTRYWAGSTTMAHETHASLGGKYRDRRAKQHEYRLLVLLVYPLFLLFAVVARLLPGSRQHSAAIGGRRRSVFTEAREAVHTVIPFAFMG